MKYDCIQFCYYIRGYFDRNRGERISIDKCRLLLIECTKVERNRKTDPVALAADTFCLFLRKLLEKLCQDEENNLRDYYQQSQDNPGTGYRAICMDKSAVKRVEDWLNSVFPPES